MQPARPPRQRRFTPVAVGTAAVLGLSLVALAVWHMLPDGLSERFDLGRLTGSAARIEDIILESGTWGPVASMLLMVLHSFVPFPAELLAVANGMVFGLLLGTLVTWTGAMLGALLAFGLARWLGRPFVRKLLTERRWRAVEAWAAGNSAGGLLAARLMPVIAFNLINYAAGLAGVGWWTFTWTTALGILPVTIASVLIGSHMIEVPWTVWAIAAAAILAAWLLHRRYRQRART